MSYRPWTKFKEEIHKDFMQTLGKEYPSYSTMKNEQQSLRMGERAFRMMDGPAAPKMPSQVKISRSCTSWLCVIGVEICEAKLAKWALVLGQYTQS